MHPYRVCTVAPVTPFPHGRKSGVGSGMSPLAAPLPCTSCGRIHCEEHRRQRAARHKLYDRRWRRYRLAFLKQHPLCECDDCKRTGAITPQQLWIIPPHNGGTPGFGAVLEGGGFGRHHKTHVTTHHRSMAKSAVTIGRHRERAMECLLFSFAQSIEKPKSESFC